MCLISKQLSLKDLVTPRVFPQLCCYCGHISKFNVPLTPPLKIFTFHLDLQEKQNLDYFQIIGQAQRDIPVLYGVQIKELTVPALPGKMFTFCEKH